MEPPAAAEQPQEGALDSLVCECEASDCNSDGSPSLCTLAAPLAEGPEQSPRKQLEPHARLDPRDADRDRDCDCDWEGRDGDPLHHHHDDGVGGGDAPSLLFAAAAAPPHGSAESSTDDYLATCEEGSQSTRSDPPSPTNRFDGHPLGRAVLELQHEQVMQHHHAAWEERTAPLRNNKWTIQTSAARAKILVSEAYFLERSHLLDQLRWLDTPPDVRHPTARFAQAFRYPDSSFLTMPPDVLADPARHREVVVDRLHNLADRWRDIGRQVAQQMAHSDEFCDVIRNLSTMRIFLEGQQAQRYGIDAAQQHRRMQRYQAVLDMLHARQAGLFLTDALPRCGELADDRRTAADTA